MAYFAWVWRPAQKKYELAEKNIRKALELGNHPAIEPVDQFHEAAAELARIKFELKEYDSAIEIMRKYSFFMSSSLGAGLQFRIHAS